MKSLKQIIADTTKRRQLDKERFEKHDGDLCMMCHAYGADKRSLFISCFYAIHEVLPEAIDLFDIKHLKDKGYYVRICKHCRAEFLGKLREWREECISRRDIAKDHDGGRLWEPDKTIPVRIDGSTVMMTPEQFEDYQHGRAG